MRVVWADAVEKTLPTSLTASRWTMKTRRGESRNASSTIE